MLQQSVCGKFIHLHIAEIINLFHDHNGVGPTIYIIRDIMQPRARDALKYLLISEMTLFSFY